MVLLQQEAKERFRSIQREEIAAAVQTESVAACNE
jgi:hypothetical protein